MGFLLLIVVLVLLFGVTPGIGPISHQWGYYPSGGLGLVLLILVILLLFGRL